MLMRETSGQTAPSQRLKTRPIPESAAQSASVPGAARFSDEEVGRLFAPWADARGILLAVSGGPDSVALMLLAAQWARGRPTPPPVSVATVDHGLRRESREEAKLVARWAAALTLPHAILVWEGVKPKSRVQERAREARYKLLFEHAAKIGADHVMTAHHADDQAETILFRLTRGSGISGLAGMARSSEHNGRILARPLLDCAKADLIALCESKAHPFVKDPSNEDPGYARTRIRHLLSLLAGAGLDREAILRLGRRAARADAALFARAEAVRAALAGQREPGRFLADVSALANEPDEILLRFLAGELKLITNASGFRLERLEFLTERFGQALREGSGFAATLGGAALRLQAGGLLTISKEGDRRRGKVKPTPPRGG